MTASSPLAVPLWLAEGGAAESLNTGTQQFAVPQESSQVAVGYQESSDDRAWFEHGAGGFQVAFVFTPAALSSPPSLQLGASAGRMERIEATAFASAADLLRDDHPHLQAALSDLDGAVDEAREEGFDTVPSDEAVENAQRVLRCMYALCRSRFEVYPMQDGAVAISAPGGPGRSVLVLCDRDGGALCSVNLSGKHRRAVYDSAAILPDGFVREALAELDNRS